MARAFVGTSGFSYGHWYGPFYPHGMPAGDILGFYARHFDTVEINSSFYSLPFKNIVSGWYRRTPEDFVFALKGSRYITHRLKLTRFEEPLDAFMERTSPLKEKRGPVLWQLPPYLKPDINRLERFVRKLPADAHHAVEFRNDEWLSDGLFSLLKEYGIAYCIVSAPHKACLLEATAPFVYIRMHGITGWYSYDYTHDDLAWWAEKIRGFLRKKLDVYIYFNNDANGFAPRNALALKSMLET